MLGIRIASISIESIALSIGNQIVNTDIMSFFYHQMLVY